MAKIIRKELLGTQCCRTTFHLASQAKFVHFGFCEVSNQMAVWYETKQEWTHFVPRCVEIVVTGQPFHNNVEYIGSLHHNSITYHAMELFL